MKTIKMYRDEHDGGPTTADVHPDEVDNMRRGDWKVVEVEQEEVSTAESEPVATPKRQRKVK